VRQTGHTLHAAAPGAKLLLLLSRLYKVVAFIFEVAIARPAMGCCIDWLH
jgi:hypothetical protein